MTLRHILVALTTPNLSLATLPHRSGWRRCAVLSQLHAVLCGVGLQGGLCGGLVELEVVGAAGDTLGAQVFGQDAADFAAADQADVPVLGGCMGSM
jgi:hypothetical protein